MVEVAVYNYVTPWLCRSTNDNNPARSKFAERANRSGDSSGQEHATSGTRSGQTEEARTLIAHVNTKDRQAIMLFQHGFTVWLPSAQ